MLMAAAGLADPTPPLKIQTAQAPAAPAPAAAAPASSGDAAFDAWLSAFRARAAGAGEIGRAHV